MNLLRRVLPSTPEPMVAPSPEGAGVGRHPLSRLVASAASVFGLRQTVGRPSANVSANLPAFAVSGAVGEAQAIVREIGALVAPDQILQVKYEIVARVLIKHFPSMNPRRVRALYSGEARQVVYEEMVALITVRDLEKERHEHRQFVARNRRVLRALAAEGKTLTGPELSALRRLESKSALLAGHPDRDARGTDFGLAGA